MRTSTIVETFALVAFSVLLVAGLAGALVHGSQAAFAAAAAAVHP